jgi:leucyl/phenylalanyl-tRNA--protein transferase
LYTFLSNKISFPPVERADHEGILAIGGDLSPSRLLTAYKSGIFPWFSDDEPIIWWAPDPRFVLIPEKLHVSKNMHKLVKSGKFKTTRDHDFISVIKACRTTPRPNQPGTWITEQMQNAYIELHKQGRAHSIETWHDNKLVGGLYGVVVGSCFCGESMFALESNASKVALIALVNHLTKQGFTMIDSQVHNDHMESMGAELIPRSDFMQQLNLCLNKTPKW